MREGGPQSVADALREFLADLALTRSPATVTTYRSLLRFPAGLPLAAFDRAFCRQWLAERVRTSRPATAATARGALSAFCSWLVTQGWLVQSPLTGIPRPRPPEPPARALNDTAIRRLLAAARGDRERLVLIVLLGTGLRLSELAAARRADLDGDLLRVRGKGGRTRHVVLPPQALALLPPAGPTLVGMSAQSIYRLVKAVARRAGLPAVSPHWLRHAWATDYYRRGSAAHLQTLGGWANDRQLRSRYARAALEDAAAEEARRLHQSWLR